MLAPGALQGQAQARRLILRPLRQSGTKRKRRFATEAPFAFRRRPPCKAFSYRREHARAPWTLIETGFEKEPNAGVALRHSHQLLDFRVRRVRLYTHGHVD